MRTEDGAIDFTSLAVLVGGLGQVAMIAWGVWALFN
jgi:hypothetical protein